ncbi:hypothetical protein Hanom_Chr17g01551531 [Helianthus anomalus]
MKDEILVSGIVKKRNPRPGIGEGLLQQIRDVIYPQIQFNSIVVVLPQIIFNRSLCLSIINRLFVPGVFRHTCTLFIPYHMFCILENV